MTFLQVMPVPEVGDRFAGTGPEPLVGWLLSRDGFVHVTPLFGTYCVRSRTHCPSRSSTTRVHAITLCQSNLSPKLGTGQPGQTCPQLSPTNTMQAHLCTSNLSPNVGDRYGTAPTLNLSPSLPPVREGRGDRWAVPRPELPRRPRTSNRGAGATYYPKAQLGLAQTAPITAPARGARASGTPKTRRNNNQSSYRPAPRPCPSERREPR